MHLNVLQRIAAKKLDTLDVHVCWLYYAHAPPLLRHVSKSSPMFIEHIQERIQTHYHIFARACLF